MIINKIILIVIFSISTYAAQTVSFTWPYKYKTVSYAIHMGKESKNYTFNYTLEDKNFKKDIVYTFLYLYENETFYITYSYILPGFPEVYSSELKISTPIIFPKKPQVRLSK